MCKELYLVHLNFLWAHDMNKNKCNCLKFYYSYLTVKKYYIHIEYKGQCSPCFDDPDGIGHDEGKDASLSCRHHV